MHKLILEKLNLENAMGQIKLEYAYNGDGMERE